ncbi:MAG: tetratricopeptide repeat protein [Actinomycetota bacterium]|nr:tetratricopeptide repeat protein [Actinomycetota bacterium]
MGVDLRVLGPLEVLVDGEPRALGGPLPRSLLAVLSCPPRRVVPVEALVEEIWAGGGRGSARSIQVYVSELRRVLGDPTLLRSQSGGYLLDVDPGDVDAERFEALLGEGKAALSAGDHAQGAITLGRALALWRGPAFADISVQVVTEHARRLDELRLVATQAWIDALLALGRHEEAVPRLQELVAREPTREALRGQLVLALYRCGRQAEALAAYEQGRRVLAEELGVDPGVALRRLHEQVLRQDPELDVESAVLRGRRRLPTPPTGFLGRGREVAEITSLVRRPTRLLTITGPGGSGKTRLALAVAHRVTPDFPGGVVFVDLTPLRDHRLVPDQVATALGVVSDEEDAEVAISDRIGDVPTLLIIDNAEHVEQAADFLARLVSTARGATLLVTSRLRLRLYGEHEYPLGPMDLDEEAVPLFRERAAATGRPSPGPNPMIREVCARLDGLPLAVELAAARARELTLADMLGSLPRLQLAADGPRDRQERQRTMMGAIAWSHDLLDSRGQAVFASMAVFAGGADAATATAVTGASTGELDHLVASSLLRHSRGRYSMLETIREFAAARLDASGADTPVRRRHADWCLTLAQEGDAVLRAGDTAGVWLDRLDEEHNNFRAALRWATEADATLAVRLAVALGYFWEFRGHSREGLAHLRAVLRRDSTVEPRIRTLALIRAGVFAAMQGDLDGALALYEESLDMARDAGDTALTAKAMRNLAVGLRDRGDLDRALAIHDEARLLSLQAGDRTGVANSWVNMADVALARGDHETARRYAVEGVRIDRELGNDLNLSGALLNLGLACLHLDLIAESVTAYVETLNLCEANRYVEGAAYGLLGVAEMLAQHGDPTAAAQLLGAADAQLIAAGAILESTEQPLRDNLELRLANTLGGAAMSRQMAEGAAWSLASAAGAARRLAQAILERAG